ncbi:MAG: hypothetical protein WCK27_31565, partial [Verrucomicrobiota bacterium]
SKLRKTTQRDFVPMSGVLGAGKGSPFREYPQMAERYSLSSGERVRVRGNSLANRIVTVSARCY